jgi:hypothetical protein
MEVTNTMGAAALRSSAAIGGTDHPRPRDSRSVECRLSEEAGSAKRKVAEAWLVDRSDCWW